MDVVTGLIAIAATSPVWGTVVLAEKWQARATAKKREAELQRDMGTVKQAASCWSNPGSLYMWTEFRTAPWKWKHVTDLLIKHAHNPKAHAALAGVPRVQEAARAWLGYHHWYDESCREVVAMKKWAGV